MGGILSPVKDVLFGSPNAYDPNADAFNLGNTSTLQYGVNSSLGQGYANRQIDPGVQAMLLAQANGTAPSAAYLQLGQGLQQAQSMAGGMAVSNANVSPVLAQRQALQAMSSMGMQGNAQMAEQRSKDQAGAQGMLANYVLNQNAQNDQMVQYFQSLGFSMDEARMKAQMALEGMRSGNAQAAQQIDQSNNAALIGAGGALAGGAIGGWGGAAAGGLAGSAVGGAGGAVGGGGNYGTGGRGVGA